MRPFSNNSSFIKGGRCDFKARRVFKGASVLTVNCSKISSSLALSTVSPRSMPALRMTSEQP